MTTLIAGTMGLFFLFLGLTLFRQHKKFLRKCIRVQGTIVEINEWFHTKRGMLGNQRRNLTPKNYPIVQYRYNGQNYEYQADTDVNPVFMPKGTSLTVLIEPMRPKAAKLEMGMKVDKILFSIFTFLGLISLLVAIIDFDLASFVKDMYDPFFIVIAISFAIFVFVYLGPMLKEMKRSSIYPERANKVD